ncbi:ABC transporter substrate-binding protein [Thermococcus piezophilus]|uniref:ABC transporter substrate-binding protein n=1 Tax=Thermococcus piezophilus TaxID=1712654 RepID=A0A172WEK9_9EURY|nr:ABC transporter substrate-binding protein [Thermococcus piezophilus]ANF21853.1 ABC transporter substrate-binding protein [Thermococcus piezophilus]
MKKLASIGLILLLALSVIASGCISSNGGSSGITLVILTRHDTTIQKLTKEEFLNSDVAKQYNIVDLKFVKATEATWIKLIDRGDADLAWGGGPTLFDDLNKLGYLKPIEDKKILSLIGTDIREEINGIPLVRYGDDGKVYWIAAALSSFGFTINQQVLKQWNLPEPEKWEDLGSEAFAMDPQMVGIADPTRSTSNTRIYQIILQAFGWDKGWQILTRIAANAKIYDASDAVRDDVIAGNIAVGTTIDFYGYTAMKQNPECVYIIPSGESVLNGDPIAIVKSISPDKVDAAYAFIYWLLTDGQKIWLDEHVNRMPVNPKVFYTDAGKQRPDLWKAYNLTLQAQGIYFDDARALKTVNVVKQYFKATLVDANADLHRVWVELVQAHNEGKITDEQFEQLKAQLLAPIKFKDPETGQEVTLTEEYAAKINDKLLEDANFRDQIMTEWKEAARQKYLDVERQLKELIGG